MVARDLVVVMELVESHFMDSGFVLKVDPIGFADRFDVGYEGECVLSRATEVFNLRSVFILLSLSYCQLYRHSSSDVY